MKWLEVIFPVNRTRYVWIAGIVGLITLGSLFFIKQPEKITSLLLPAFYEQEKEVNLTYGYDGQKKTLGDLEIYIEPRQAGREEVIAYLQETSENFENLLAGILSEEDPLDQPLKLPDTYRGCKISYIHNPHYLNVETGWLTLPDQEDMYTLSIQVVVHYEEEATEFVWEKVINRQCFTENYIRAYEDKRILDLITSQGTYTDETFIMPEIEGIAYYAQEPQGSWVKNLIAGLVVLCLLMMLSRMEYRHNIEEREREKKGHIVYIMNHMLMLVRCGMTIQKSFYMALKHRLESTPMTDNMRSELEFIVSRSTEQNHFHEVTEAFLQAFNCRETKYLVRVMRQNLHYGDTYLVPHLEQMSERMWYERLKEARKNSEKASSKLIFPMLIIFVVIILISVFPSFIEVQLY